MDIAAILDKLVPAAKYGGSLTARTQEAYEATVWKDDRDQPTWAEIEAGNILILRDQKIADLNEYYENYKVFKIIFEATIDDNPYSSVFESENKDDFTTVATMSNFVLMMVSPGKELKTVTIVIAGVPEVEQRLQEIQQEITARKSTNLVAKDLHISTINALTDAAEVENYDYTAAILVNEHSFQILTTDIEVDITAWIS